MFSISGANTIMEQQHQQHQQQLQQQQGLQAQGQEQPLAHDGAPSAAASNDEDPSGPQPEGASPFMSAETRSHSLRSCSYASH